MIVIKDLTKSFGTVNAVDNLSVTVEKGEIFGLLGENGAGKTTTLRMLATMLKPTSGTATLNGFDIQKEPEKVRGEIGILFGGESGLYNRLTVAENISYFAELNNMDKQYIKKRIKYLAEIFEMEDYINKPAGKLSKGMRQKAAFARAIVHDPNILLLDEPSAGLDVSAMIVIQDFIKMQNKLGKTIIFSSHTMSEVDKLCNRIAIIHKGKLVDVDTLDNFKNKYNSSNLEQIFIQLVGEKR